MSRGRNLFIFLMHLNDEYESIRGQILLLDPLPNVNKAYAMIQRVETQRQVTGGLGVVQEMAASVSKTSSVGPGSSEPVSAAYTTRSMGRGRRDAKDKDKASRYCAHCRRSCHNTEQCSRSLAILIGIKE